LYSSFKHSIPAFIAILLFLITSCGKNEKETAGRTPSTEQIEAARAHAKGDTTDARMREFQKRMVAKGDKAPGAPAGSRTGGGAPGMRPGGAGARRGQVLIPVEIGRVERRDMADFILASTTIEALRVIDVFAKTTGILEKLLVEEGDAVSAGDTLVVLDDREARLNLRRAEITYREAENSLGRSREMMSRNLISQEEFETRQLAFEKARTDLHEAELAFEYTRVTAPIGGIITERFVELGSMITQGKELFRLADFNPLRARIYVPEKELRRIKVGQKVLLSIESEPDREFPAVIELISSVIDPSSGTFKVTVEIDSAAGVLRPGMFASARIVVDRHVNTLVVPAEAVLYEGRQRYIYVARGGVASRIDVGAGFSGDGCIEISGSVEEGDTVVVAGHNNLAPGTMVEVVKDVSATGRETCEEAERGMQSRSAASPGRND
jgi:membrane fusion protein (multidrug efflux system)